MADLTELHQDLARVVLAGRGLSDVLTEITAIARRAMPGTEAVSITLIRRDVPFTAAYDGLLAMRADEVQYGLGYGPCVDAGRAGLVFLITDMKREERWSGYAQQAAEFGIGSSLSVPLPFQSTTIGALNSYAAEPHAFDEPDVALGEEVATWVALAVSRAQASDLTARELQEMRIAMASRATIEQAKGILMERFKVTPDQAFTLLSRTSQTTNTKLRDLAEDVVRTGVLMARAMPGEP
ncbi:ANTAR domain-containing protein [uncultured Friedmanniella sp.]|uniref:ANTAR domain-containing protein n=1 Tax=uncultured Friedmanniella sp. TaxID=335381 RepID=UPI0035CACC90